MKRHRFRRSLSDDHHRALALARRLRRLSTQMDPADLDAVSCSLTQEFEAQIEPHSRDEQSQR